MLPIDGTRKLSFNRCIHEGYLVIVYERHDVMKPVKVSGDGVFQNRFGVFKHGDWVGKQSGSKVFSNKGGFVYLLAPTPELWTLVLSHRTQILYIADISFIVMYLEIVPGCVVWCSSPVPEVGPSRPPLPVLWRQMGTCTPSIFMNRGLRRPVQMCMLYCEISYLLNRVRVLFYAVLESQCQGYTGRGFSGKADSIFLDLPQPWSAIPSAAKMLQQDGVLCSFSPCIEQVQKSCETLKLHFTDIRTFEVLLHTCEVREGNLGSWQDSDGSLGTRKGSKKRQRPANKLENSKPPMIMARRSGEAKGHTGYLTMSNCRVRCAWFGSIDRSSASCFDDEGELKEEKSPSLLANVAWSFWGSNTRIPKLLNRLAEDSAEAWMNPHIPSTRSRSECFEHFRFEAKRVARIKSIGIVYLSRKDLNNRCCGRVATLHPKEYETIIPYGVGSKTMPETFSRKRPRDVSISSRPFSTTDPLSSPFKRNPNFAFFYKIPFCLLHHSPSLLFPFSQSRSFSFDSQQTPLSAIYVGAQELVREGVQRLHGQPDAPFLPRDWVELIFQGLLPSPAFMQSLPGNLDWAPPVCCTGMQL
ncbi:tRNA (adenine(58)-N(1))-methyltransferasecatalytic subunit TRM61 [Striga asiatica]|uniref:tRNA (adenine(58)-N(1))-methyltransferase n=1 Tax=Striga asiatica TaxID=4170 RepID=A0A5A7QCX3_STRAF|nr:tRNA (adenine(58)-N(1))-methyltransferasecatalytic subunit TRM61 [Striga asiatica]